MNIQLNILSLDISSFASVKSDLGEDNCEEAESKSSEQLMSDTLDSGDVDSMGFLANRELGWVEVMSRKKDCKPSSYCILGDKLVWTVKNCKFEIKIV